MSETLRISRLVKSDIQRSIFNFFRGLKLIFVAFERLLPSKEGLTSLQTRLLSLSNLTSRGPRWRDITEGAVRDSILGPDVAAPRGVRGRYIRCRHYEDLRRSTMAALPSRTATLAWMNEIVLLTR
ncbi:hypothetical protein J6590_058893 [Homalodisca vitripennis]|nr:hypothetical protein J6590_058893 [Homalodisca vitripennis]